MQEGGGTVRLLTYRELLLTLQKLCKEKRTGVMFIKNEARESAKLALEKGVIFDVAFRGVRGEEALALIKEITQGKATFSSRLGEGGAVEKKINLTTVQIFQVLTANIQKGAKKTPVKPTSVAKPPVAAVKAEPEIKPAVVESPAVKKEPSVAENIETTEKETLEETVSAGEWGMVVIEAQLAAIIGHVAKIVFFDYVKDIHVANDFKALNAVIEKISKDVLMPTQQKLFRQKILGFISQHNLKGYEAILQALRGADKKLRVSNSTLGLCVAKHAIEGAFGLTLINKLVLQVEQAGNLGSSIRLLDVLKLIEKSDKTGLLEVREKGKIGGFYFDKGVLINAVECGMNGKIIAMDILQWEHDYMVFRAVAQEGVTRQIQQTVDVLAKEAERLKEKEEVPSKVDPSHYTRADEITLIAKAITLTEGCDGGLAEQILTSVLMDYDHNFKGWLWLSRALTNMTAIEVALKKAAHIHSKNADLAEEVRKFSYARKTIESEFVIRCPFCWMPTSEKDSECSNCKSNFFIDPSFFKTVGKAKFEILDAAIERYSNVLQKEVGKDKHIYLRFYLAMAYLNRKYFQEGLDQLHEIARLAPDNHALITQGRILMDYMNAEGLNIGTVAEDVVEDQMVSADDDTKPKILIVEDSLVTRKVIARTLMANGYEIFEAKNAFEALTGIEDRRPNLVLLDIILPGKDGYEILEEIRKKPMFKKVPVIMLTSRDGLFDKLKGKVSDANEYLTKPFQPDELLTVVRKYLR